MTFGVHTTRTPFGDLLFAEVSEGYSVVVGKEMVSGKYEASVVSTILNHPARVFVDVGAAFGYFTLAAASAGKSVVAFEPHPIRYGLLRWNTRGIPHVSVRESFVSDVLLRISRSTHPAGLLGNQVGTRVPFESNDVRVIALDQVDELLMGSTLIKIDVEGFELNVLNSLSAERRAGCDFIVEVHTDSVSVKDVFEALPEHTPSLLETPGRKSTVTYLFEGELR